jgi:pimeloyl-ACP methyl ester carboxylesterase
MTCGFTSQSYGAFVNASNDAFTALQLPGNPLNKDSLTENVQMYASRAGSFCDEFENKEYLAHMNTPNVVRDFDLIRNLTGYDTLDYWGFSYGTVVGAMYAHMYPDRVGKMVLDGSLVPVNSS